MGARTNYTIITTDNPDQNINVYAHWDGEQSEEILAEALKAAEPRWDDMSYCVRIIIDQLTKNGRDEETGYGIYIGSEITHEEQYETKEVNLINKTVSIGNQTYDMKLWLGALV